MSKHENEDIKDWICNNATKDEIRFNDTSDILSSDNSDSELNNSSKVQINNRLNPRTKLIYKLLHSTRSEGNKTWRTVESNVNLENCSSDDEYDNISFDNFDIEKLTSIKAKNCNQLQSKTKIIQNLQSLTSHKADCIWRTAECGVDLKEKYTEPELETVSCGRMVKSHKRKHGDSVTDEGEATTSKKIRTNEGKAVWKKVKCKENSHSLSESEDEDSDRKVTGIESNVHSDKKESNRTNNDKAVRKKDKHKENRHSLSASEGDVSDRGVGIENKVHSNKNKRNRNSFNTHLLSSESGSAAELSFDLSSNKISLEEADGENGEVINSECRSRDSSEDRQDLTVESTQKETGSRKMPHRIPKFTHEFNEEISKFSLLLDENLIKKNDIWILQCPSNMDCSALISQRLGLEGSSQLNDGERTYETYSYRNSCTRTATLAVPSERNCLNLCKIPITGNIIVEESVKPVMNTKEIIPEPPSRVEFPKNLRTRHPLLGIDFSKQPRTAEKVADHNPKKKKHSVKLSSSCNGVIESGSPSISTPVKKKKKNQERSREEIIQSDYAEQLVEEFVDGRAKERKKKKKHKDNDSLNYF